MKNGFIYIDQNVFPSLFAISSDEQSKGLMYVSWPPPIMSFVYGSSRVNRFWMANTPAPLDILFCNSGKVLDICYGEPYSTRGLGECLSDLVIELPYGTVEEVGIKVGQEVGIVQPTVAELQKIIAAEQYDYFRKL